MQLVGRILWWNDRDGFGVIEDEVGTEFYFDSSVLVGKLPKSIKRNQIVIFEINPAITDCVCAYKVRAATASQRKKIEVLLEKRQLRLWQEV